MKSLKTRNKVSIIQPSNEKTTKEKSNMENNEIYRMPLIGDKAPEFKAVTTQGNIDFPKDYEGKWVILFSHPAISL